MLVQTFLFCNLYLIVIIVITILITTIVVGSVSVYAATKYFASDISFTPANDIVYLAQNPTSYITVYILN